MYLRRSALDLYQYTARNISTVWQDLDATEGGLD
jgi:hypothetical protein